MLLVRLTCLAAILVAVGGLTMTSPALALEARVGDHRGSPFIFVNGQPTSPLTFFGWESGGDAPTDVNLTTEWQQFIITVESPEHTEGQSGIHFRLGGGEPGTVWVDDIRVYPGEVTDKPAVNWAREGDFEGTREDVEREWDVFAADYAGVKATWDLDQTTKVSGKQSLRVEIESAGGDHMHLHWYQKGYSVREGQKYTYSLWMKADKPRTADFMMLHIGEPWTIYRTEAKPYSVYTSQVMLARDAGVDIVSFGIGMPWPRPGEEPNFAHVDAAITNTLRANPKALLLPRFGVTPPGWWLEEHPDECMVFDDGPGSFVSMASEPWREEMQVHLRALVRHCEEKYGDHMLGYHPCGQHTGEWFYERSWEPRLSDFSPAMDKGFRQWLQGKYGTEAALRRAWNDSAVTFATVAVPSKEEMLHTSYGFFRDPQTEGKVVDYFLYKQIAMEEPLEMMARVIKEETKGRKLTCFFYGYLFDMHGLPMGPQGSGHLAMDRLLKCPDVDILCSPISYLDREQGGAGCFMTAVDSVRTRGKLWLNEDDTRTYLTPTDDPYSRVGTSQGTQWVHQRNFAQLWPRRLACWYMDLGGTGWLNGKDLWDNIGRLQRFYQQHLDEPAQWQPEVALIVDEDSPAYGACNSAVANPLVYQMRSQYFRLGTGFGMYYLSDLVAGRIPPMKAYFFANCYHLDAKQRQAVLRATRGKTAVWFYGGGFLSDNAADANMRELIGLNLERAEPEVGRVTPSGDREGLAAGLRDPFGTDTRLDPLWTVNDPAAEVIARYPSGAAAVAAKQTPEGLRVYVGALHCPARLLRDIARASGVHLYSNTDDVVLTDGRFLALSATSAGRKRLTFPGPRTVVSALDSQVVAEDVTRLELELQHGETRLYLLH